MANQNFFGQAFFDGGFFGIGIFAAPKPLAPPVDFVMLMNDFPSEYVNKVMGLKRPSPARALASETTELREMLRVYQEWSMAQ